MEFAGKTYPVIYADPPWEFKDSRNHLGRNVSRHYNTMSVDDIKSIPVASIADKDSILFLWITNPRLELAKDVISAWGFQYKTVGFTWVKQNKDGEGLFRGMGRYTRSNPEQCLIATRGKVPSRKSFSVDQLIIAPRREHSRKPDEIYDRIEALYDGPYVELFSRTKRKGWTVWGNETGKFQTSKPAPASKPTKGKLSAAEVIEIRRQFHEDGAWQADIAARFGVSVATVSRCIHQRVFGV